jgi:hypothetical protein
MSYFFIFFGALIGVVLSPPGQVLAGMLIGGLIGMVIYVMVILLFCHFIIKLFNK